MFATLLINFCLILTNFYASNPLTEQVKGRKKGKLVEFNGLVSTCFIGANSKRCRGPVLTASVLAGRTVQKIKKTTKRGLCGA